MYEDGGEWKCKKKFRKAFNETTRIIDSNQYAEYRRRDNRGTDTECSKRFCNKTFEISNGDVVPYNPYLCQKFNCHINVESCHHISAVKYLYKYIYKSLDEGSLRFEQSTGEIKYDEISSYVDGRYLSAPEACWRIFAFPRHDNSHSVQRLAIHLPDEQPVFFQDGEEQQAIDNIRSTTLTAFFEINRENKYGTRNMLYTEMINVFRIEKGNWVPRKKKNKPVISRMHQVSPKDVERYHLRILLLNIPGPTSFEDIRTVDGVVYLTFKQACAALGLIEDDANSIKTMTETVFRCSPAQCRRVFAFLILFCDVTDALALWETFKGGMCEDFTHRCIWIMVGCMYYNHQ